MKIIIALISLASLIAQADEMKSATLNLVCKSSQPVATFRVVSDRDGGVVFLGGNKIIQNRQFIGGTEGGDPYLQEVKNGYNFTIEGGDFKKAFYGAPVLKGSAPFLVITSSTRYKGVCKGSFSFH